MDRDQLATIIKTVAAQRGFLPRFIEKDYHLTVLLGRTHGVFGDILVLKGGTLLNKFYLGYHRLSEDIDMIFAKQLGTRGQRSKAIDQVIDKIPEWLSGIGMRFAKHSRHDESRQFHADFQYDSVITGQAETIAFELTLRHRCEETPVLQPLRHPFVNPFDGKSLLPDAKVLCLTKREAIAEKLRAAIARRDVAIRDYFDLWIASEQGFDFTDTKFVELARAKLQQQSYRGDPRTNFGLTATKISSLRAQMKTDLEPFVPEGIDFDLDRIFERFNAYFSGKLDSLKPGESEPGS